MSTTRILIVLSVLFASAPACALCTPEGAYGIRFGEKIGLLSKKAVDPDLVNGPYLTTYSVKPKTPDPRFTAYLGRVENDAKVIYVITGLKNLFTAESSMMPGDEFRARVYPILAELAAQVSKEQGLSLEQKNGGYYTAFTSDIGIQLSSGWDGRDVYAELACINLKLNHEAEQSATKKLFECMGDGSVYKPECHQGPAR